MNMTVKARVTRLTILNALKHFYLPRKIYMVVSYNNKNMHKKRFQYHTTTHWAMNNNLQSWLNTLTHKFAFWKNKITKSRLLLTVHSVAKIKEERDNRAFSPRTLSLKKNVLSDKPSLHYFVWSPFKSRFVLRLRDFTTNST